MCFSQFSTCKLAREARLASEHAKEAMASLYKSVIPCNFVPMA